MKGFFPCNANPQCLLTSAGYNLLENQMLYIISPIESFLFCKSWFLRVFLVFSCLRLSASHSSSFEADKDPIWRYWNKCSVAILSTGCTQLNLMLGCPCGFSQSLTNKLICSNFVTSSFASASCNINSTLLGGCA